MTTFTSASEMARAKRMHRCDLTYGPPPPRAEAPAASFPRHSDRISHQHFEHDKTRHLAEVLNSPPRHREVKEEPNVCVHARHFEENPPYHTSCRELSHEKIEHLTPLYPSERRGKRAEREQHALTSNEELSSVKRKHTHEMDSVQRQSRSAANGNGNGAANGEEVSVARSVQVTSAGQFSADKALHRRAMDEGYERAHEEQCAHSSPQCKSSEKLSRDIHLHRHRLDECIEGTKAAGAADEAQPVETDADGKFVSVARLGREIKAHRYELDSNSPRHIPEPERCDAGISQRAFEKKKKNHDIGMEGPSPIRARSEEDANEETRLRSNHALTQSKKSHSKDIGGYAKGHDKGQSRYNSNETYSTVKRKHRHTVDTYGADGELIHNSQSRRREEEGSSQCLSARRLMGDKRKHKHNMDCHREGYTQEAVNGESVCRSNHGFAESKRRHRHEIDSCSPARTSERQAQTHMSAEEKMAISHQALARGKRGHRVELDSHRSPQRSIFDTRDTPVIEPHTAPAAVATPPTPAMEAEQ